MKLNNRYEIILLCILSVVGLITACSEDEHSNVEMSSMTTSETAEATEDKTPIDPLDAYREESTNIVPIGVDAIFDDSDTGISYSVRVTSVEFSNNYNDLGIGFSDIDGYLFDLGQISADGYAEDGYTFMSVSFEVMKESDSSTIQSDPYRSYFSLSDSSIFQENIEHCEMILAGFNQPSETKLPEEDMRYFMQLSETGNIVQCNMVYMVKTTDNPIIVSVRYFDELIMFSLEVE